MNTFAHATTHNTLTHTIYRKRQNISLVVWRWHYYLPRAVHNKKKKIPTLH